ncbi:hypothetical protein Clacol_000976 [Clathrus columnatus]|uniref:Transposase n=1 Tax=Clathrus columnatus TaxID=1419009 RepID=A0AAV4ZY76_9AGAM|nr:hypothetical protein Clacol_000976 [Clathrus columnatus]
MKVLGMDFKCAAHRKFSTASTDKFWKHFDPWLLHGIPHFNKRSAYTRELYDLVCEFRLQSNSGQLTENIFQLHRLETRRLQSVWLDYAISNKRELLEKGFRLEFPELLQTSANEDYEVNPAPTNWCIRSLYDHFFENQHRKESEQYLRTLAGHTLGLDAMVKLANKANIYISANTTGHDSNEASVEVETHKKKITVFNPFGGGLLTAVNEDKELVFWELITTNSPVEMLAPLSEYAIRCEALGVDFRNMGEICVDHCCDFCLALNLALPNVSVVQDLMHLKMRILDTVPKKSAYRETVSSDLTKALVVQSASEGKPAIYHSIEEQAQQLQSLLSKYQKTAGVWTSVSETAFKNQFTHIAKGCLQRRHKDLPSHTSGNENWHGRLNSLSRGDASSLPTIVSLVTDAVLRLNLKVNINNLSQPIDSMSRQFRTKASGSHHLYLLNHILRQTEELTGIDKFGLISHKGSRIQTLKNTFKGEQELTPSANEFIEQVTLNGEADCLTPPSSGEKRSYSQFSSENETGLSSNAIIDNDSRNTNNDSIILENQNKQIKLPDDNEDVIIYFQYFKTLIVAE